MSDLDICLQIFLLRELFRKHPFTVVYSGLAMQEEVVKPTWRSGEPAWPGFDEFCF